MNSWVARSLHPHSGGRHIGVFGFVIIAHVNKVLVVVVPFRKKCYTQKSTKRQGEETKITGDNILEKIKIIIWKVSTY